MIFLHQNDCRIYFDLGCINIKGNYIPLEDDKIIASIVRLKKTTILKPRSVNYLVGKIKQNPHFTTNQEFFVESVNKGYLCEEPNLELQPALMKLQSDGLVPIMLTNNSTKTFKLRRGCVLAKLCSIDDYSVETNNIDKTSGKRLADNKLNLDEIVTPKEYLNEVTNLIIRNKDLFAKHPNDIGLIPNMEVKIPTRNGHPPANRYFRLPFSERPHMEEKIRELIELIEAEVIKEGRSPYSSPALLVKKRDGTRRLVINFRQLNKSVITNPKPLPRIDDVLSCLNGAKYFTCLDLISGISGYHQLKIAKEDQFKTCFSTHNNTYVFNRLPMGLNLSSFIFQETM